MDFNRWPRWSLLLLALLNFQLEARAGSELDRQFTLETVGLLKSWDNVDGLFADYVARAYENYFSGQSRFKVRSLKPVESILNRSPLAYQALIDDPKILEEVARKVRAETLIRTKVYKEGAQYRFSMDWLQAPKMNVLGHHGFVSGDSAGSAELDQSLKLALGVLFSKVPFLGHVTGRDQDWVTVNMGSLSGVEKGDTLLFGTLDQVKEHPLTRENVDWKLNPVGQAIVQNVEDQIAFAKVQSEEPGQEIRRYHKVTQLLKGKPSKVLPTEDSEEEANPWEHEKPLLGFGGLGLLIGSVSREYHTGSSSTATSGNGFAYGIKSQAQLWFTDHLWAEAGFSYATYSYSQKVGTTGSAVSIGTGSLSHWRINAVYALPLAQTFYGPRLLFRGGYHSFNYGTPSSSTDFTGSLAVSALYLGMGGEIPIRDRYGVSMGLDLGIFKSAEQSGFTVAGNEGSTDISFNVSGTYMITPKMTFMLGFEFYSHGMEFSTTTDASQTAVLFTPTLLYYF